MAERYDPFGNASDGSGGGDGPYGWISEWLCEYVDGTMDPSMQAVFEEYMEANPELAAHVERLCHTRALLNDCECEQEAADRTKARLQEITGSKSANESEREPGRNAEQIEAEIEEVLASRTGQSDAPGTLPLPQSRRAMVAAASALTLMLGVGLFAGAVLFAEPAAPANPSARPAATQQAAPDRPSALPPRMSQPRTAASGLVHTPAWRTPPLPLKKMPTKAGDTTQARSASPLLLQQTGLNTPRP